MILPRLSTFSPEYASSTSFTEHASSTSLDEHAYSSPSTKHGPCTFSTKNALDQHQHRPSMSNEELGVLSFLVRHNSTEEAVIKASKERMAGLLRNFDQGFGEELQEQDQEIETL